MLQFIIFTKKSTPTSYASLMIEKQNVSLYLSLTTDNESLYYIKPHINLHDWPLKALISNVTYNSSTEDLLETKGGQRIQLRQECQNILIKFDLCVKFDSTEINNMKKNH